MKKSLLTLFLSSLLIFTYHAGILVQEPERTIGIAYYLKPSLGKTYEFEQALIHYTKTYRTDPKYAVRAYTITGGPKTGNLVLTEPPKTWSELDEVRPYQSEASARAWQNILKHCDENQLAYFTFDNQHSNPIPAILPTTKFISYFWELDPKASDEAFATELYKATEVLKNGGYKFVVTRSLSGRTLYQIQFQFENGWKDMEKNLPPYKELFIKAYPGKGEWEKHQGILQSSTKDFYIEYRTLRTAISTR